MTISVASFSQKGHSGVFITRIVLQAFTFFPATYSYLSIIFWLLSDKSFTALI